MEYASRTDVHGKESRGTLRRVLSPCFALLSLAFATSVCSARAADRLATGTYRQVSPQTGRVLAIGNELVIANDGDRPRRFSLNAIRPSDNNSGYVGGTLASTNGLATWASKARDARCQLTFVPLAHRMLKITQNVRFGDCGFGYGVTASGTYARIRATGKLGPWNGP